MIAPTHYASHAELLRPLRPGKLSLGGIIVPATRPATELIPTLVLGASLNVPIVVLCSGHALPYEVIDQAARVDGAQCTAIDMFSLSLYDDMPPFETQTDQFAEAIGGAYGDLSLKRNLGLLIGRLAGWTTLLFLDDDIVGLSPTKVRRAVGALEHLAVVGMPATEFPDNSVVCHARRRFGVGQHQGVFISGSALTVNVETANSFFPSVYNEDWLFLAPHLDRRLVTSGATSRQKPYYPFDSPDRAVRQEFGDVLAEGLIGHLHTGTLARLPSHKYWAAFLSKRAALIAASIEGCNKRKQNPMARDAMKALKEAEKSRSLIETNTLVEYLDAWQSDLSAWRGHIRQFNPVGSMEKALAELGLLGSALTTEPARGRKSCSDRTLDVTVGGVSSSR